MAVGLQASLGQPVVVENRPGANGTVGTLVAARAAADGTTLTMGITDTFAINRSTFRSVPYSGENDFAPVSMVTRMPFALMVGGANSLAVDNRARILALARPSRIELMPNMPTLSELGVPLATGLRLALYAPARTSAPIIARLNAAMREGMRHEQTPAVFRQQAGAAEPSTHEELAGFAARERVQRAQLVQEKNIRVE